MSNSGNPWVRSSNPPPSADDDRGSGFGGGPTAPGGGFSRVQLPSRPQRPQRQSGGFFSRFTGGGGPPRWLVAAVAAFVVVLIVTLVTVKLLGGEQQSTTPTPTPMSSTPGGSPTAGVSTPGQSAVDTPVPPPPPRPSDGVPIPEANAWLVPAPGWVLVPEPKAPQSREWKLSLPGQGDQAYFWVRARPGVDARMYLINLSEAYSDSYPGVRLGDALRVPCQRTDVLVECQQLNYNYNAGGSPVQGTLTTYQHRNGLTISTDFGTAPASLQRTRADAVAMTNSLVSSF